MHIGKVSGTVVATFKDKVFEGKKLLIVDRLTPEGEPTGHYWIAVDDVQAGVGDTVMIIDEGNSAIGFSRVRRDCFAELAMTFDV